MCNIKMRIKQKGALGGFGIGKTSLEVGFPIENACFLVESEGICTINHVISYKRGGFWKPPCVIFLVSILKNAYLVRKLTTKKKRAADELLLCKEIIIVNFYCIENCVLRNFGLRQLTLFFYMIIIRIIFITG